MTRVRPVVLSGGSGTRLWPLSVGTRPKQFIPLVGDTSLFRLTLQRAALLTGRDDPIVVTGAAHAPLVEEATSDSDASILVEPGPRNTAPAIVAAALISEPDDVLVVLPSDHVVEDDGAFVEAARVAIGLAEVGGVVAFGCVPTRPEAGYGWIRPGEPVGGGFEIEEFVEKPDSETAEAMLVGGYLWNSGMFVLRASTVLEEDGVQGVLPAVANAVEDRSGSALSTAFLDAPSMSFDHAVMESTPNGRVVPLSAGWSDIGSWQAVWEIADKDASGNSLEGNVYIVDATNVLVHSTSRPVAVVGVADLIVVETPEGVLVLPRERSQEVREVAVHFGEGDGAS